MFSLLSLAASVVYVPEPILSAPKQKLLSRRTPPWSDASRSCSEEIKLDYEAVSKVLKPQFDDLQKNILAELKKTTDAINADIGLLKAKQTEHQVRLDEYKKTLDLVLKKVMEGGPSAPSSPALDKASLDEIRGKLNTIQDALAKLAPTEKRVALSMPNGTPNAGRVMLVNLYSDVLLFTVNGVPYRLPARTSRMVDNLPSGSLRYEVFSDRFGVLDNQATTLAAGETFTVTASSSS